MRDDRICITWIEAAVPNAVGIDDCVRSVEARAEAAAWCCEDTGAAAREQLVLHGCENLVAAAPTACGFSARDGICADEQVAHLGNRR